MNEKLNVDLEDKVKPKLIVELLIIFALSIAIHIFARRYDILERIVEFSWNKNEIQRIQLTDKFSPCCRVYG